MLEMVTRCCVCDTDNVKLLDSVSDLVECQGCRYVFVSPRPTADALAHYYSKPSKYDRWLEAEEERDRLWERRLKLMLPYRKHGNLLDVGAGIGQLLAHARPYYTSVSGTEISSSAIQIARDKFGVHLTAGQLEDLPFDRRFDNIALYHILEHVPNPASFLQKCQRLLTPHGVITVAVPNDLLSWELKIRRWIKAKRGRLPSTIGVYGIPKIVLDGSVDEIHLSQFTPASLAALCERSGFEVLVNGLDPYFAKKGWKRVAFEVYYQFHQAVHALCDINRYNTIFLVARKTERRGLTASAQPSPKGEGAVTR